MSYKEIVFSCKNFGASFEVSSMAVLGDWCFLYVTQLCHIQEDLNTQFDIAAHITSAVISASSINFIYIKYGMELNLHKKFGLSFCAAGNK